MSDWSWDKGGSSGGGSSSGWSWDKPSKATKKTAPSGGGGFWDDIGGAISHELGRIPGEHWTAGRVGAAAGVVGALGGQSANLIHGSYGFVTSLPGDIAHTLGPHGVTANLGTPWDKSLPFYHHHQKPDPHNLVQTTARQVSSDIQHLSDPHYVATHPLNYILDAATIYSLGGTSGLRLARAGRLGTRASELANEPRLLHLGEAGQTELRQSRSLFGRARQAKFDRWSEAHRDAPIFGSAGRVRNIAVRRALTGMLRARIPVRHFQEIAKQLFPAEKLAYHIAAQGVPLYRDKFGPGLIEYYAHQVAERPTKLLRQYLEQISDPRVAEALTNPRQEFIDALNKGAAVEAAAGERLVAGGKVSEQARAERAVLPQRIVAGAEYSYPEKLRNLPGETPKTIQIEGEWLGPPAEQFIGQPNRIHPDFPDPFRFRHVAKGLRAGLFTGPKTESMLGPEATLAQTRRSFGVRFQNATFMTDPERVITADYLSTARHGLIQEMRKEVLIPASEGLSADHTLTGFKRPDEWYIRTHPTRKTAPIDRNVREAEGISQDRPLTAGATDAEVKKGAAQYAAKTLQELGVDAKDAKSLERLNQLGIRRVPAKFGKDFSREFAGTHWALRYFYDRPMDVWRAITLNFRPAWAVNNFVGNAIMGLSTYGVRGAAWYLRVLFSVQRGEDRVRTFRLLRNFTFKHPTLRRTYGHLFSEVSPEQHGAGLFGTQTSLTHKGATEGHLANFKANPAVKYAGIPVKIASKAVMGVGGGITKLEILLAEDTGREAAFIIEAGGDIAKIKAFAKKMEGVNLSTADAIRRLDQRAISHANDGVIDVLGDFNNLSPFERSIVRRAIPFYSWFKVIAKVSGKYAARYPARLKLLQAIEDAKNTKGEPALPSWLAGALRLGNPHHGVQSLISTQGINPYETLNQISTGGPVSLANPLIASTIIGATGRNPVFGSLQDYYGLGATSRGGWPGFAERFAGSLVGNLAPVRLLQGETQPYPGRLYDPTTYKRNLLLQYLGLPLRDVKVQEAKRERGL